jgi:hypothetical protein
MWLKLIHASLCRNNDCKSYDYQHCDFSQICPKIMSLKVVVSEGRNPWDSKVQAIKNHVFADWK